MLNKPFLLSSMSILVYILKYPSVNLNKYVYRNKNQPSVAIGQCVHAPKCGHRQ